jgi:hypothetical protein
MWRLRSSRREEARSLRSETLLREFRAIGSDFSFLIFEAESVFLLLMKLPDFGASFGGGGGEAAFGNGVSRSSATEDLRFPFFFISLTALKVSGAEFGFWNCEGAANLCGLDIYSGGYSSF